jgi:hypothetical protein
MKFLLNHQADGWLMLDVEGNRSLGLFDTEEKALERAWSLATSSGIDAVVYSRNSSDDDSIIVVSGLKRCTDCGCMRPAEDFYVDDAGDLSTPECASCRENESSWPAMVVLDDIDQLTVTDSP